MKVLVFGAGASRKAGYPLATELMQRMEQEAKSSQSLQLAQAWTEWESLRDAALGRLQFMLKSENPEVTLSLLDLYEQALRAAKVTKQSRYVAARNCLLECLRWYFLWRHRRCDRLGKARVSAQKA